MRWDTAREANDGYDGARRGWLGWLLLQYCYTAIVSGTFSGQVEPSNFGPAAKLALYRLVTRLHHQDQVADDGDGVDCNVWLKTDYCLDRSLHCCIIKNKKIIWCSLHHTRLMFCVSRKSIWIESNWLWFAMLILLFDAFGDVNDDDYELSNLMLANDG